MTEENTASVPLLARVSGVTESLAEAIVAHRDSTGADVYTLVRGTLVHPALSGGLEERTVR